MRRPSSRWLTLGMSARKVTCCRVATGDHRRPRRRAPPGCSLTARHCACQEADTALEADAAAALGAVDARLRDNMDTRGALDALLDLILRTNKYMEQRSEGGGAGAPTLCGCGCVWKRCIGVCARGKLSLLHSPFT